MTLTQVKKHTSSFPLKHQILPPSSHEPNSPPHLNPLLDNISDVPPKPLNPQPLQSHPSLDITLSLSPITPLDHTHDTTSPPSPPQPQPPIMGHPLFYNYHDYYGSTCIRTSTFFDEFLVLDKTLFLNDESLCDGLLTLEIDLSPIEDKTLLALLVWICQKSQEISQKRTRERMSDQEAKEIMPQPSTVNCS
ncbi:hypothetical protein Tco_0979135 [Tanacetum coccineum]